MENYIIWEDNQAAANSEGVNFDEFKYGWLHEKSAVATSTWEAPQNLTQQNEAHLCQERRWQHLPD